MVDQGYAPMAEDSSDPFAAPSDPFTSAPAADPFAAAPSDPFAAAPSDPFAAAPSDPFAQPGETNPPSTAPEGSSFYSEMDEEELERQRLRDAEYQERMQALYQREEAERTENETRRDAAKTSLADWAESRAKAIETRKKTNADEEAVFR